MKEGDWKFPEGQFLAHVLGPVKQGQRPIFIVLNAAPQKIPFNRPKMAEYKSWRQVLNTTETKQIAIDFASGADTRVPPRSVLAFMGRT